MICLFHQILCLENLDRSVCESDSEDERLARVEATKLACAKERIRLKAIDANKKVMAGRGSPVTSKARRVSKTPRLRAASTDSLEPVSKKSKPVSGIARIIDLDEVDMDQSDWESEAELDSSEQSEKDATVKDGKANGGSRMHAGAGHCTDKTVGSNNKTQKDDKKPQPQSGEKTSKVLPQRFWPSDMSADQVNNWQFFIFWVDLWKDVRSSNIGKTFCFRWIS